jgi:hypothetical protein
MVPLEFFIDIILPAALWFWGLLSLEQKQYQEYFLGSKGGRCLGLTSLSPSCADCLQIWEPVMGLLYLYLYPSLSSANEFLSVLSTRILRFLHACNGSFFITPNRQKRKVSHARGVATLNFTKMLPKKLHVFQRSITVLERQCRGCSSRYKYILSTRGRAVE